MFKKKSIIAMSLVLSMALSGCGGKKPDTTAADTTAPSSASTEGVSTTEEAANNTEASIEEAQGNKGGNNGNSASASQSGNADRALSFDQASDMLMKNDKMVGFTTSGLSMIDEGTEEVEGNNCRLIGIGKDSGGKFTTEYHFAVARDQSVYEMNVLDGSWSKVESEVQFAAADGNTANNDKVNNNDSSNKDSNTANNNDNKDTTGSDSTNNDTVTSNNQNDDVSTISKETQYEVNIFLSNFAEANAQFAFDEYTTVTDLVNFIHIYAKINAPNRISYDNGYEVLELDWVLDNMDRFFNYKPTVHEVEEWYESSEYSYCSDGKVYYMAADGETYNRLVVVDTLGQNDGGDYVARFSIYSLDLDEYFSDGIDESYYYLNSAQAAATSSLTKIAQGEAVLEPLSWNGHNSYKLLGYTMTETY